MKRSSGSLVKEMNGIAVPTPKKRTSRWTLLLVGDRGNVVSVGRFKGLMITLTSAILVVVALAVGLYFLYKSKADETMRLQSTLEASRKKVKSLQDEKELLMVRLVLAESKIKTIAPDTTKQPIEPAPAMPQDKSASASVKSKAPDIKHVAETEKEVLTEKPTSVSMAAVDEPDSSAGSMEDEKPQMVSVDDVKVLKDSENHKLHVKFKLRKTDQNTETVSGHAFVVLKRDKVDQTQWLIMPSVSLASGKPSLIRRGQFFSIARFKAMKFEYNYSGDPHRIQYIMVLVYAPDGTLLLEKESPITIQDVPSEPTE